MSNKWDGRYLGLAFNVSQWSKDPSTKVGAVIVNPKNQVVSLGYNGFPKGVQDLPERYNDRETKLLLVSHAERNAMDNAPVDLSDCTIYTTLMPCNECCKSIIVRGIKRIVSVKYDGKDTKYNHNITKIMCEEAEITISLFG